jgi:hypothetical protein
MNLTYLAIRYVVSSVFQRTTTMNDVDDDDDVYVVVFPYVRESQKAI